MRRRSPPPLCARVRECRAGYATTLTFCPMCAGRLVAGVTDAISVMALEFCTSIAFFKTNISRDAAVRCCDICVARLIRPALSID